MTEKIKRRGRQPKQDETTEEINEVVQEKAPKEMTFAEVMAWNRENADKMPPLPEKPLKKPRKMTRM